jgi:hypothetical protein
MKALAVLLACPLCMSPVSARDRSAEQIAQVRAQFAGKSLSEINDELAVMRPAAATRAEKQTLLRDLPLINEATLVTNFAELIRLKARLEAALRLHDRAGVVDVIVFRDSRPIVYNKPGVVVVLSTEVLKDRRRRRRRVSWRRRA